MKTHMERNRERIAKVREQNLRRRRPPERREHFTVENDSHILTWDERSARAGIVVTIRSKTDEQEDEQE